MGVLVPIYHHKAVPAATGGFDSNPVEVYLGSYHQEGTGQFWWLCRPLQIISQVEEPTP